MKTVFETLLFAPVAFFIVMLMRDPGVAIAYGLVAFVMGYPVILLLITFFNRLQKELDIGKRNRDRNRTKARRAKS